MSDTRTITQDGKIEVITFFGGGERGRCFSFLHHTEFGDVKATFTESELTALIAARSNEEELQKILATMDLPPARLNDVGWLWRNIKFANHGHPHLNRAIELLKMKGVAQ